MTDAASPLQVPEIDSLLDQSKPSLTPDQRAAQIDRLGVKIGSPILGTAATVTYGFATTDAHVQQGNDFVAMGADQQTAVRMALKAWGDVANVRFVEADDATAKIHFQGFSHSDSGASGMSTFPGAAATDQSVSLWMGTESMRQPGGAFGAQAWIYNGSDYPSAYATTLHEIGHALGLSHPSDYQEGPSASYAASASYQQDTKPYSIMSYFNHLPEGAGEWMPLTTPGIDDILAAQRLYGANMGTRTGDTVYGFNSNAGDPQFTITDPNQHVNFAIWDAGGNDTLDFSGYGTSSVIDLRAGHFSSVGGNGALNPYDAYNVSIAYGVTIENAIGGDGAETIYGNEVDNHLSGNGGNDVIFGMEGHDYIMGGAGADTIDGGDGNDHLYGSGPNDAGAPDGADLITGGAGDDYIQGNAGADELHGGDGNDRMQGGADGDLIWGDAGDDLINGNAGDDVIRGGAGDDVIHGGKDADTLFGDEGNDVLMGDMGNDTIHGGAGIDILSGGQGANLFTFDRGDSTYATTGSLAGMTDRIIDYQRGIDHIAFDFGTPDKVVVGTAAAVDAVAGGIYAATLLAGDELGVAAVAVGTDTVLYTTHGGTMEAVLIQGMASPSSITAADFVAQAAAPTAATGTVAAVAGHA